MSEKALHKRVSQEEGSAQEGMALWEKLVGSVWELVNAQIGLKEVEPRMKGFLGSLRDLESIARSAEDPSILSIIEAELRRLNSCMERSLSDFEKAKPIIEETLRLIWNKRKA